MLIPSALQFLYENRESLPHKGSVLDFGDQLLYDFDHASRLFPNLHEYVAETNDYEKVTILYTLLGLGDRKCIDYNNNANFRCDLNHTVIGNPEIDSRFDLVTNQGFSEHVFNQFTTFEAIHHACRAGGLMLHVLPCQGWADGNGWGHGFYQYQPNFFLHLARANSYNIIDMRISPFSPDPFCFEYDHEEYSRLVNFHLSDINYVSERRLGRPIFTSLLVLMKMPDIKSLFVAPHE